MELFSSLFMNPILHRLFQAGSTRGEGGERGHKQPFYNSETVLKSNYNQTWYTN